MSPALGCDRAGADEDSVDPCRAKTKLTLALSQGCWRASDNGPSSGRIRAVTREGPARVQSPVIQSIKIRPWR